MTKSISFLMLFVALTNPVLPLEDYDVFDSLLDYLDYSSPSEFTGSAKAEGNVEDYEEMALQECSDDDDCDGSSMKCIRYKCITTALLCKSSDTCPIDMECLSGTCIYVDKEQKCSHSEPCQRKKFKCYLPKGVCYFSLCQSSSDCPGDSSCILGQCTDPPCVSSQNCPVSHTCIHNRCINTAADSKPELCSSHIECVDKFQAIDVACIDANNGTHLCHSLDCETDENCPQGTQCHHDVFHSYCSAFKCKENKDCTSTRVKGRSAKCNKAVCRSGRCELHGKLCNRDSQCKRPSELCLGGKCEVKKCSTDQDCPFRSKCHPSKGICRKMTCQSKKQCLENETCEEEHCVVPKGSSCRHHIHCHHTEVCGKNKRCEKRKCQVDKDCRDERLNCHPSKFCTASLDYALGMKLSQAYALYKKVGYFQKPEEDEVMLSEDEKKELDRELGETLAQVMADFPSQEELTKWANNYYDELDLRTSLQGQNYSGFTSFSTTPPHLSSKAKKLRVKRQGFSPQRRPFLNRRRSNRLLGSFRQTPNNRFPRAATKFDTGRINGGDPALAPFGSYGEALLTISEQIIKRTSIDPLRAAKALQRKKHDYCRWRTDTSATILEIPQNCAPSNLGDPRFTRLFSGACNNLTPGKEHFGILGLPFSRLLTPDYSDGINAFRLSRATGEALPNPRVISNRISFVLGQKLNNLKPIDDLVNSNFVFFAQFVDHDLTNTFPKPINQSTPVFGALGTGNCCGPQNTDYLETYVTPTKASRFWCISIKIPKADPLWSLKPPASRKECLHQQVTQAVPDWECHFGPRQIMNQVSNWLDLSQIYNSKKSYWDVVNVNTNDIAKVLLDSADGGKGFLPRCPVTARPPNAPPISCATCFLSPARTPTGTARSNCFIGGDFRTDENVALASEQTIWAREHNRIVDILRAANPTWSPNKLFHEARRINVAQYQHIIYNEYLPLLVGPELMKEMNLYSTQSGYSKTYDPEVEPTIMNVFATASYRFGHAMLPDRVNLYDSQNQLTTSFDINDIAFRFDAFNTANFTTQLFRGLMFSPAGRVSGFFAAKARDALNASPDGTAPAADAGGFDLLAWNINRGRDHGIPAYHTWVELTSKNKPKSWKFFEQFWERGPLTALVMKSLYKSWKDIDLYLGALLEVVKRDRFGRRNQVLGPTHAKIVANQFARLKKADRFFYESNADPNVQFELNELNEIKKVTMSMILCNNLNNEDGTGPNGFRILPHAFLQPHIRDITPQRKFNQLSTCADILKSQPNYQSYQGSSNIS